MGIKRDTQKPLLEIVLFGATEARVEGNPIPALHSRKGVWLLALLALRQGRALERRWLAETLWADSPPEKARFNLRQTLADLRRALGSAAACLQSPNAALLQLQREAVWVDVVAFDARIASQDLESLREAVALYRGALLEDCPDEWAQQERIVREQGYLEALHTLAEDARTKRQPTAAISYLRRLLAADPLREESQRALMQALFDGGDEAAVTQVYRDLRLLLHRELNAQPAPQTEALYRDLQQRMQRRVPVEPSAAPPNRRLPVPLTRIIGREREVADLAARLETTRLLTLTGPGGVGKTRLAIAAAEEVAPTFPEGVWFVELAALSDPQHLPHAVARAVRVAETQERSALDALTEHFATRRALLILDNCEHLLDSCAALAYTLLTECPTVQILATSRQALGVTGEQVYPVPSLALPPEEAGAANGWAEKNIHALRDYPAIDLFVERLVLARPSFRLTRENSAAVCRLCARLDGIPLALELAAARAKTLGVAELAERLDRRFDLLMGGSRAAPPRQQTLRALIDWSYDLLEPEERRLFARLGVFYGGWTLAAAEAVCAEPEPAEIALALGSLAEKSLVVYEESHSATDAGRYGMLETIREYSQEKLRQSGAFQEVTARHAAYYRTFATQAEPQLYGDSQTYWFAALEAEQENLRAALEWYATAADGGAGELDLAGQLGRFWDTRGYLREGAFYLGRALERPGNESPTRARAKAALQAGWIAQMRKDPQKYRYGQEARDLYRALNDLEGLRQSLYLQGTLTDAPADARPLFEEYLRLSQQLRLPEGSGLMKLGFLAQQQADPVAAQSYFERALTRCREEDNLIDCAVCLTQLGKYAAESGAFVRAQACLAESLALAAQVGAMLILPPILEEFCQLSAAQGDSERAAFLLGAAEILRERFGMPPIEVNYDELRTIRERAPDAVRKAEETLGEWTSERIMAFVLERIR